MSLSRIEESFAELHGSTPEWIVRAPGRINLIGEHIDYLNGFVMPAAIDRYLTMAVRANGTDRVRIWSSEMETTEAISFGISGLEPFGGENFWLNYVAGVVEMLRREGLNPVGFDATITSDLPSGAGLSSSAALETATSLAVEAVSWKNLAPIRRAELCRQAEHEFAGVPCGIMDQIAVGLGREHHALMLDCRDSSFQSVKLPEGISIVVSDTRVHHALGDGEYRKRRESCDEALGILQKPDWREVTLQDLKERESELGSLLFRRSRHVVTEMARVRRMRDALTEGDLEKAAAIMKSGHGSLRDDYEVSCPELDCLVDAAYEFGTDRGLVGARMTGGGFGGSTVSLVRDETAEELISHLESAFREKFHTEPNCFTTRIADGASVVPFNAQP